MSCNCKTPKKESEKNKNINVLNIGIKLILYFISMSLASIFVIPFMAVLLFRTIVLNKSEIDVTSAILKKFGSKNKNTEEINNSENKIEHLNEDYFNEVEVLDAN